MSWVDNLQQASFRGVAFGVVEHENSGGRRLARFEFPYRDEPFVQDLGRKAHGFSVSAFVVGDDYMAARDRLLDALEAEGPGRLVHPWLGERTVRVDSYSLSESAAAGGMAVFRLAFVEAGAALYPSASDDTAAVVSKSADDTAAAAQAALDASLTLAAQPSFVTASAASAVQSLVSTVSSARSAVGDAAAWARRISTLSALDATDLAALAADGAVSATLDMLFSDCGAGVDPLDADASGAFTSTRCAEMLAIARAVSLPAAPTIATAARATDYANRLALADFTRVSAVAEACRSSATATISSAAEANSLRRSLCSAIDTAQATAGDASYAALTALRASVVRDLAARAKAAPAAVSFTPRASLPVLALAHDVHQGAGRPDELLARNAIRHPGFVPGGQALEVLRV